MMDRSEGRMAGLILAAGSSSRMGRTKQLLTVGGKTLLETLLVEALKSRLHRIFLVIGHEADKIRASLKPHLDHPRLEIIENPDYPFGISSSILAGLAAAEEGHDHLMILLGDMPFIRADLVDRFLEAFLASGRPLGAVLVKGRRSHPVIFSRGLYAELSRLRGDQGARDLFHSHAGEAFHFPADYDDRDIDTPEDYAEIVHEP
jgi:molybdenum cofactor cytidylyltransferase